ncbi:MAG: VWA domain-containing protein [Blastocatellia bacterium]
MKPGKTRYITDRRRRIEWLTFSVCLIAALLLSTWPAPVPVRAQQQQQAPPPAKPGQKPEKDPKKDPKKADLDDDPGQVLRVGTQLINVLFSVSDKQNRYINDITKEEITVLEDGKPQQIFTFKKETDLPLTMALLVDVSGSEKYVLPLLKEAGLRFFSNVMRQGKDTAGVVKFERDVTLIESLTSNPQRLKRGLEKVSYVEPPPSGVFGGSTPPINSGSGGTSMFDAVVATAHDLLAGEAGRKTMILLTDGEDTTSRMKIADAINDALRAEASVYAIGIGDPGFGGVNKGVLNKLCEATGGRAYFPQHPSDLDRAFAELEQDLRQQYLLAYEPEAILADGGFRKIEIRVGAARKEPRIRHRRGYYAPRPPK